MKRDTLLFGKAWKPDPEPGVSLIPAPRSEIAPATPRVVNFPAPRFALRAPGQRKLDHGARARIAEWRAHQATWSKPIDAMECDAQRFHHLRRHVLYLNRKQTARILRASVNTVLNWENGTHPVPFYAYLALVLISESLQYRFANEAWRDWKITQRFNADSKLPHKERGYVAELSNASTGATFLPKDLEDYRLKMYLFAAVETRADQLQVRVTELTKENAELRERSGVDGVAGELHDMRERLSKLAQSLKGGGQ